MAVEDNGEDAGVGRESLMSLHVAIFHLLIV